MPEMKGITVKIPADLHAEVKAYLEAHGMTMGEFIAQAVDNELHPKIQITQEDKNMERMRTLAFQVPDSLFQRVKAYLERNHMTQKQFVVRLIEAELEQDEAPSSPAWPGNFVAPMPCIVYTTKQEKGGGTRELHPDAQGHPCCGFDLR